MDTSKQSRKTVTLAEFHSEGLIMSLETRMFIYELLCVNQLTMLRNAKYLIIGSSSTFLLNFGCA